MKVLVTGGGGYIGSTVASAALDRGHDVVIVDNLVTGRLEFTAGRQFYRGDIADAALLDQVFGEHGDIAAAVHCAALIDVEQSVRDPVAYYGANVTASLSLARSLLRHGCRNLIFSSSASVYAASPDRAVNEQSALAPSSPYARTKFIVETMLSDIAASTPLRVLALRYFNPIGADPQMRTGNQAMAPSHLLGRLIAAQDTGKPFTLFGTDWPTRDGTAIRDYVHVWDLAQAHVAAIERLPHATTGVPFQPVNLGTGSGTTVAEFVDAFRRVSGRTVTVERQGRRRGDIAGAYSSCERALALLGWVCERSIEDGISDSLRWAERRPLVLGY